MNDNMNDKINVNALKTEKSEYCCLIGRDSRDNEQRELSPGTSRMFSEVLHTLNYTSFLLKVRDTFLDIERGESFYEHTVQPKTFFYCPMTLSDERSGICSEAAAVWGECGLYGEGREFRYAHFFFEEYKALDPHELFCKLFSTRFLGGSEITALFDRDKKTDSADFGGEYSRDIEPKPDERLRKLSAAAAERLCDGKTVVIKLTKAADFNSSANEILRSTVSLLPGELRKQIGFAAYLQKNQLRRFMSQSNNLRLIVVDSDVELSELETARGFAILEVGTEYEISEDFDFWSHIAFSERELHAERFAKAKRRVSSSKLITELSRLYRENGLLPEPSLDDKAEESRRDFFATQVAKSESEAESKNSEAVDASNSKADASITDAHPSLKILLSYREVKLIAACSAAVGAVIGLLIGLIL